MWKEGIKRIHAEWTGEEQRFLGSHAPFPRGNRTLVCLKSMGDGLGTTEGMDLEDGSDGPEMPQREGRYGIEVDECLDTHTPP